MTAKICKVAATKVTKVGRPRTFRFRLSDGSPDRVRDRLSPLGWRLVNYQRNPIVLWAHDATVPAIGKLSNLAIEGRGGTAALMGDVNFPPPGIHPLADQVHDLIGEGIIASGSVGFIPIRSQPNELGGTDYLEQELTEFSIVNVGALPSALLVGRADVAAIQKWLGNVQPVFVRMPAPPRAVTGDRSVPRYRLRDDDIVVRLVDDAVPRYHVNVADLRALVRGAVTKALVQAAQECLDAAVARARGVVE
ncbi:MAG: hypothetical protein ABII82_10340 [Verrucomicrobiota bacterium]